ncbi:hypothetical protein ACFYT3_00335 [Nocardia amikacinitolerans]|uniref:hypothetical protein n=1 Tax=Nocardia amikacinitolerans TaxID=756689 RepID=UPI0027E2B223|nr:hypothetical protein [Nocardia amikacinitolerans]MCP2288457.1 hypothetical protein [Nocardia amikacinitolerans]
MVATDFSSVGLDQLRRRTRGQTNSRRGALSAAQLAATTETLLSPMLAAAALDLISFRWLLVGAATGFAVSAVLVITTRIPNAPHGTEGSFRERITLGMRIFAAVARAAGAESRGRSRRIGDPTLFAAQFSLPHPAWLITYPIAGWLTIAAGFTATWITLAVLAGSGITVAPRMWPRYDPEELTHPSDGIRRFSQSAFGS